MAQKTVSRARFVINMNTGAHGYRTSETDALPLTFKLIDDDVCKALCQGKISGMQVVEMIKKDMFSKPGFKWEEYDRQRQAEKQRMNVSQHDMVPVGDAADKAEEPEVAEEVLTLGALGLTDAQKGGAKGKSKADPAAAKEPGKSVTDAVNDALSGY